MCLTCPCIRQRERRRETGFQQKKTTTRRQHLLSPDFETNFSFARKRNPLTSSRLDLNSERLYSCCSRTESQESISRRPLFSIRGRSGCRSYFVDSSCFAYAISDASRGSKHQHVNHERGSEPGIECNTRYTPSDSTDRRGADAAFASKKLRSQFCDPRSTCNPIICIRSQKLLPH